MSSRPWSAGENQKKIGLWLGFTLDSGINGTGSYWVGRDLKASPDHSDRALLQKSPAFNWPSDSRLKSKIKLHSVSLVNRCNIEISKIARAPFTGRSPVATRCRCRPLDTFHRLATSPPRGSSGLKAQRSPQAPDQGRGVNGDRPGPVGGFGAPSAPLRLSRSATPACQLPAFQTRPFQVGRDDEADHTSPGLADAQAPPPRVSRNRAARRTRSPQRRNPQVRSGR